MPNIISANEAMFTAFEPKVQNRFIMYIEGIPAYLIKAANRPKIQMNTIKLDHINVYHKVKGKAEWQDLEITLYDPIVPSGYQAVMEWIRLSHESVTGRDGYASMYKKDINLSMLGPVGDIVESWTIKGAWISNASSDGLDWSQDSATNISLTLVYDYAILDY